MRREMFIPMLNRGEYTLIAYEWWKGHPHRGADMNMFEFSFLFEQWLASKAIEPSEAYIHIADSLKEVFNVRRVTDKNSMSEYV